MTPQSSFTIVASIKPADRQELRELLASMNHAPGRVDPLNPLIPFQEFEQLHFARCVILDDLTTEDIMAYGLPKGDYPTYLTVLGDIDGPVDEFLENLVKRASDGLKRIFIHCEGFAPNDDLLRWVKDHCVSPAANYVNWIGRTAQQVREEEKLHQLIASYVREHPDSIRIMTLNESYAAIRRHVSEQQREGRIVLSPPARTPLEWKIHNLLHLLGMPLLLLITLPLLLIALPFFLIQLRRCEQSDPEIAPRVDSAHADLLASLEDHDVTNSFNATGTLKPGWFRLMTTVLVLRAIDYTVRHIFCRGRLARVTSIQFARWVFLDGRKRMIFASNYDGSLESYMDDFINKVAFGLNVVFSNGVGYPRTNWLIKDGAKDEQTFKDVLRRHQVPSDVWYNAHPGLTALDKRRNSLIREGIEKDSMTEWEIREWLRLL